MSHSSSRRGIHPQHFPTQDEREEDCFFWWSQKLEEREIVGLVVAKMAKMHFHLQSLIGFQTRKCVMNYEQEGIHWRIKIQLSSLAASKYLIVRQWHCDGCLRDKYSAVGPPGTAGGQRDYKSTASKSFAQKACKVILTAAPNPKSEKFFPPLGKKNKILHRWEAKDKLKKSKKHRSPFRSNADWGQHREKPP